MEWDHDRWPNFAPIEFRCRHTGRDNMDPAFLDRLQALRTTIGIPFHITSGFRDPTHPAEARKGQPGAHAMGRAADVAADGSLKFLILKHAIPLGFTGIGVAKTFIHLDDILPGEGHMFRPVVWTY